MSRACGAQLAGVAADSCELCMRSVGLSAARLELEQALRRSGIPHALVGMQNFFERKQVKVRRRRTWHVRARKWLAS